MSCPQHDRPYEGSLSFSLAYLDLQLYQILIMWLPIAAAPSVFDCAGLDEVDADVFDFGFT
jgi:hypothetical protein